jgi:hypothetical protein
MTEMTVDQRDALQIITDEFAAYGIAGLATELYRLITDNTSATTGQVATATVRAGLRASDPYKLRFAGNDIRARKVAEMTAQGKTIPAGAGPLTEASYVEAEIDYRETLRKYNMPVGFYDDSADFVNLIGNDIRPEELDSRAKLAQQAVSSANPEIKQQLRSLYGVEENQILSFFLDPERAQNVIRAGNTAIIAGTAQKAGITLSSQEAQLLAEQNAPGSEDVLSASNITTGLVSRAGLEQASVSGEVSGVTGSELISAAAGDATAELKVKKEREKRQAEYQSASGMAETAKGVVGLQRANL